MRGRDLPDEVKPHTSGVVLMLMATCLFGAMGGAVKWAGHRIPVLEIAFFRSLFGVLPVAAALAIRRVSPRPKRPRLLLWRAAAGCVSMLAYFYAIVALPLSDAVLLGNTAPIFVAFLAPRLLGEKTGRGTWVAVGVSLAGVVLILQPRLDVHNLGTAAALGSGLFAAFAYVAIRRLSGEAEDPDVIALYFPLVATALTGALALRGFHLPPADLVPALVGMGIVGGLGQILMTRAYSIGPIAPVAAASYGTVVVSWILGVWIFDEPLLASSIAGGLLVVASGIWLAARAGGAPSR